MAKIMDLKFELLKHPPYSPDLATSDFFFKLEKVAEWTTVHVERGDDRPDFYFEDLPKSYFLGGLRKLEKCLEKCIELKEDYYSFTLRKTFDRFTQIFACFYQIWRLDNLAYLSKNIVWMNKETLKIHYLGMGYRVDKNLLTVMFYSCIKAL